MMLIIVTLYDHTPLQASLLSWDPRFENTSRATPFRGKSDMILATSDNVKLIRIADKTPIKLACSEQLPRCGHQLKYPVPEPSLSTRTDMLAWWLTPRRLLWTKRRSGSSPSWIHPLKSRPESAAPVEQIGAVCFKQPLMFGNIWLERFGVVNHCAITILSSNWCTSLVRVLAASFSVLNCDF